MGDHGAGGGLAMALGMLAHMPWYHYVLIAAIVIAAGVVVHLRIRRRYWPQHATMAGISRTVVEQLLILAGVELIGVIVAVVVVGGGMVVYHQFVGPV